MESKCPVCQKGTVGFSYDGLKVECSKCWFRCHVEHLPRIAAAMELARMEVKLSDVSDKSSWYADARDAAHRLVIEVFGGE
jgi:hypothetical protein